MIVVGPWALVGIASFLVLNRNPTFIVAPLSFYHVTIINKMSRPQKGGRDRAIKALSVHFHSTHP